jgi:hypothetical protein
VARVRSDGFSKQHRHVLPGKRVGGGCTAAEVPVGFQLRGQIEQTDEAVRPQVENGQEVFRG